MIIIMNYDRDLVIGTPVAQIQQNIQQPTATQLPPARIPHPHIDELVSDINKNLEDESEDILDVKEDDSDVQVDTVDIQDYLTLIIIYVLINNSHVRNMLSVYIKHFSDSSPFSVLLYGILFALLFFISRKIIPRF
jgi:hypothetical protein